MGLFTNNKNYVRSVEAQHRDFWHRQWMDRICVRSAQAKSICRMVYRMA